MVSHDFANSQCNTTLPHIKVTQLKGSWF